MALAPKPLQFSGKDNWGQINKLKQDNLALRLELEGFRNLEKENLQLRKALKLKGSKSGKLVAVEIVAYLPSTWRRMAIVDRGALGGVETGLLAIDESGNLLGKIFEVEKKKSYLVLIDDPEFSVSVFIGDKAFGLLKGTFSGAKVLYIEETESLKVGDKVWLKAEGLASPIDVGEVRRVKKNKNSLFWDVDVKLYTKSHFSRKIFLVK